MKHSVDLGELKWDSRAMQRSNIVPGDILRLGGRLVLVVHSTDSSAKVIPVLESDINDDTCTFSATERGEVISSFICYNERGGGTKLVGRLPSSRLKMRESIMSRPDRVFPTEVVPRPVQSQKRRPVMVPVSMTVVHDDDGGIETLIGEAARSAARTITSNGLAS